MSDNESAPVESPLDRLRRLAAESQASRLTVGTPPPPADVTSSTPTPVAPAPAAPAPGAPAPGAPASERTAPPGIARPIDNQDGPAVSETVDVSEDPDVPEAVDVPEAADVPQAADVPEAPVPPIAELTTVDPVAPIDPVAIGSESLDRHTSRGLKVLTGVLALLVVLAAVGLVAARHHQHSHELAAKDTQAARAAAAQMMVDIETVDYTKVHDWLPRVIKDATGAQVASFNNDVDAFDQATVESKLITQGHVVTSAYCNGLCASAQVAGNTATAIVFTDAHVVTSVQTPAGGTSLDRWLLKLVKVKGKWLVVNVDTVPNAPAS